MQEIHSREYERKLQLLPGSEEREAALVDSIEELKLQMEEANRKSKVIYTRNKIILISTVVLTSMIFLSSLKRPKLLATIGSLLSISALIKGANSRSLVKEVPDAENNFSATDRAYSFIHKVNGFYNKSEFLRLVVKVTLDIMIATKLIKLSEIKVKQDLLKTNKLKLEKNINEDIKGAILEYGR